MSKLVALFLAFSASSRTLASPLSAQAAVDSCLAEANVPVDIPGSEAWEMDAAPFNIRTPYQPIAIAVPLTAEHVQAAVICGVKAGVKVTAKCGGHSYANFGFGGEDGHLMLEMDRMHNVTLDKATGIATVQGGSRLGHVAFELWNQGKRAISHGTCPGVGSGGHVLHGGYGMSSHYKGLALDWLVNMKVVLANGTLVTASDTENADLYWAMRGAGSSFGVVVEYQFRTFEPPAVLTPFMTRLNWNNETTAKAGLKVVQDWVADGHPAELTARLFINKQGVNMEGLYYGDKSALDKAIDPLLKALNARLMFAQPGGWIDQLTYFGMGVSLDQTHPYSKNENFYSSSLYVDKLTDEELDAFTKFWFGTARSVRRDWYVQIDFQGGKTSAVSAKPNDESAYSHRSRLLLFQFYDRADIAIKYPADGHTFLDGFVGSLTASMRAASEQIGMYFNYPDPRLEQDTAQVAYWGEALPRLQELKAKFDPDEVFYLPQSVRPAQSVAPTKPEEEESEDSC